MSPTPNLQSRPDPKTTDSMVHGIGVQLLQIEQATSDSILRELKAKTIGRDRSACDEIFGTFTNSYLVPCLCEGLGSRAANFARVYLVPAVLRLEQQLKCEFHKGALFYDTALAHLLAGNEDGFEYFLAMTDEEETRTNAGTHQRGTMNLRSGGISAESLVERLRLATSLLNGSIAGYAVDYAFMTGLAPLTATALDAWRKSLDALHQFELLRAIHDVEVFVGAGFPNYSGSRDNPFVLLRLAKALSHLAQWVESCLTQWQVGAISGALSRKLINDADFGLTLSTTAGSGELFAGRCPHGADIDVELQQLLSDLAAAAAGPQREWRILRILYIVRNSTAHTIEPSLRMYQDRQLLLNLIQVTFVSVFVIAKLKSKPMP